MPVEKKFPYCRSFAQKSTDSPPKWQAAYETLLLEIQAADRAETELKEAREAFLKGTSVWSLETETPANVKAGRRQNTILRRSFSSRKRKEAQQKKQLKKAFHSYIRDGWGFSEKAASLILGKALEAGFYADYYELVSRVDNICRFAKQLQDCL